MLKSMTGYGNGVAENDTWKVTAEIKTLNSKTLDLNLRVPRSISEKEGEIRLLIAQALERGKVSTSIEIQSSGVEQGAIQINQELFKTYYHHLKALAENVGAQSNELFRLALNMPDVIKQNAEDSIIDSVWPLAQEALKQALAKCNAFREEEGQILTKQFTEGAKAIGVCLQAVAELDPARMERLKERIRTNLLEVVGVDQIDENRFEQELIYYIEKFDITEEKVRLKKHLDYFNQMMSDPQSQGKKLGFITQEIGREINTIGSKANDADIQRNVIGMKDELEKVKEQLLNIL